jgi:hypothetical protein
MADLPRLSEYQFALVSPQHRDRIAEITPTLCLAHGSLQDSESILPRLLVFGTTPPQVIDALATLAREAIDARESQPLPVLVQSAAEPSRMQQHLAAAQLRMGPRGQRAWLRLHDASVWMHLPRVLDDESLRGLFGPIVKWTWHSGGIWYHSAAPQGDKTMPAWRPETAEAWAGLLRVGAVNRAARKLNLTGPDQMLAVAERLDLLVAQAQHTHGITGADDLAAYACFGWQTHPAFDEHPIVRRALSKAALEGEANVVDVLDALTPQDRQTIRDDFAKTSIQGDTRKA